MTPADMTPARWAARTRHIDALVAMMADNISTADYYEDEWRLRRDAAVAIDEEFYHWRWERL